MPVPVHGVVGAGYVDGWVYAPGGALRQQANPGSTIHQAFQPPATCE